MISKQMSIGEVIRTYPETVAVFKRFGLDCNECQIAELEALEHGAGVHKVDLEKLFEELYRAIAAKRG